MKTKEKDKNGNAYTYSTCRWWKGTSTRRGSLTVSSAETCYAGLTCLNIVLGGTVKLLVNRGLWASVEIRLFIGQLLFAMFFSPLESRGNYNAISNNMKLVHWPLMGGLLHLVQRGGDWVGPQPTHPHPRCTKCNSPPINGQCTNHYCCINGPLLCGFNVGIKSLNTIKHYVCL